MSRIMHWTRHKAVCCASQALSRHLLVAVLGIVVAFHFIGNVIWISANKTPLPWDESYHVTRSIHFTQFIQGVFGGHANWNLGLNLLRDGYGPLIPLVNGIIMLFTGIGVLQAQIVATTFFVGAIFSVYLLANEMSQDQSVGVASAIVFSFYQLVYAQSRWPLLDIPVTLFVTLTLYFIAKDNFTLDPKNVLMAGFCGGLAMLVKAQAGIYLVLPALCVLCYAVQQRAFLTMASRILLLSAIVTLLFSVWAIRNGPYVYQYLTAALTIKLNHPDNLAHAETWLFYLKMMINNITTFWGFLLMVPAVLVYAINHANRQRAFVLGTILGYYLVFSLISNKDLRFLFPVLPLLAFVFASGWKDILNRAYYGKHRSPLALARGLITLLLVFEIVMHATLSFGWPGPNTVELSMMLPGFNDVTILNTKSDYPVKRYSPTSWPTGRIAADAVKDFEGLDKPVRIFVIPNFEYLNLNNLTLELTQMNSRNVILYGASGRKSFGSEEALVGFVDDLEYLLFLDGEFGPLFQWDREFYSQVQREVERRLQNGGFAALRSYLLPNGEIVYLLRATGIGMDGYDVRFHPSELY